jgi:hypothetical protein
MNKRTYLKEFGCSDCTVCIGEHTLGNANLIGYYRFHMQMIMCNSFQLNQEDIT